MTTLFLLLALAQPPVPTAGVSVQMAPSQYAQPLPQADQPSAVVVALTASGKLYLGIQPITPAELPRVKSLFFKADARAPYSRIVEVLDTLRHNGVTTVFLLTDQKDPAPGVYVQPKGIELLLAPAPAAQ